MSGSASRNTSVLQKAISSSFSEFDYDFFMTTYKGNAKDLTIQAIDRGFDTVVCIGGDGTFNEVLQACVHNKRIKIAIIPTGAGNSISNYIGMNRDLKSAFQQVKEGKVIGADCFLLTTDRFTRYGMANFSFGLSADSFHLFNKMRRRTIGGFSLILYKVYQQQKKHEVLVEFGSKKMTITPLELIITNINQFGMNVKFMKQANFFDRYLYLYIVEGGPYWRFLKFILINYLGFTDTVSDLVERHRCKSVKFYFSSPCHAQMDAESFDVEGNVEIKIEEDAVQLIVPNNSTVLRRYNKRAN